MRHAFAEFTYFAVQVFDILPQLPYVLSHVPPQLRHILPQAAIADQDQPAQGRPYCHHRNQDTD